MPNYRDNLLAALMFQMQYPGGYQEGTAPQHVGPNDRRGASMQASLGEDAMLRHQLGRSSREARGNEAMGHTVMSDKYPGFARDLWGTERGFTRGYRYDKPKAFMTPDEEKQFAQRGRDWGDYQRKLVGRRSPMGGRY